MACRGRGPIGVRDETLRGSTDPRGGATPLLGS
jgi:hypothetical protein